MNSAFYISATHKSSGKTTLSIGIAAALHTSGRSVQTFKKGPDFIDPMWLGQASGRPCHNLDFYTQGSAEIEQVFTQESATATVALVEGNKGLFDGLDLEGSNSNAALAKLLDLPVILVLDTRGTIRGVAPLLLGYQAFDPEIRIAGVILNRVGGARHETKLRGVIEHYTDVPVLGAVHHDERLAIVERHLGLLPSNEADEAQQTVQTIAEAVRSQVDLEQLTARCVATRPVKNAPRLQAQQTGTPVRIGIAADSAFGFYYPGDLRALEAAGAELQFFSTLEDHEIPAMDGLIIGGGFPETHLQALADNQPMRRSLHAAISSGLPTYAECGGLMYLSRSIRWRDGEFPMVGVIPGDTVMQQKPVGKGYVQLESTSDHPWYPNQPQRTIAAHEFHYSRLEGLPAGSRYAYRVKRGAGIDGQADGYCSHNLLANYAHLRHVIQSPWAEEFVQFVRHQLPARRRTDQQ